MTEVKDLNLLIDEVKELSKELSRLNDIMKDIRDDLHSLNMKIK